MIRVLEFLLALAIVAALMLVVAIVLPSSRHIKESVETNRRMTIVYDTLNSFRRFKDWNPLVLHDPSTKLTLSGPAEGVGATLSYAGGKAVGSGSWKIVKSEPGKQIDIDIQNEDYGSNKRTSFLLEPTGRNNRNVRITQTYDVDYGWNLLGRYAGLYVNSSTGEDVKMGLRRLSNMLATVPNVDYTMEAVKPQNLRIADVPAEHLLVVEAGAVERKDDKLIGAMKSNMEWINRTMAANGLTAAGPMRIVSNELGTDTYAFDVVQPVTKAGAGAAALTGLSMQGPVKYAYAEPGRAVTGSFKGLVWELENVRNALRAWAMTQGVEVTGRPYDIYKNGPEKALSPDGEFELYWGVKK